MPSLTPSLPDFSEVMSILESADAVATAAEAHGMLCGFVCAGDRMNGSVWIDTLISQVEPDETHVAESRDMLIKLYEVATLQFKDPNLSFRLLLPDDDTGIVQRVEALSCWCRGYLSGLGLAGIRLQEYDDEDVSEVLKDLAEIAKVDYEFSEHGAEDELAYQEIMEYVRIGTILIYDVLSHSDQDEDHEQPTRLH